jgi:hypothetical protein
MNNQNSWAYTVETEDIFRDTDSVDSDTIGGDSSLFADGKIDTEAIFNEVIAQRRRAEARRAEAQEAS